MGKIIEVNNSDNITTNASNSHNIIVNHAESCEFKFNSYGDRIINANIYSSVVDNSNETTIYTKNAHNTLYCLGEDTKLYLKAPTTIITKSRIYDYITGDFIIKDGIVINASNGREYKMRLFRLMKAEQNIYKSYLKEHNACIKDGITLDMRFTTNIWDEVLDTYLIIDDAIDALTKYKSIARDMGRFYEIEEYYIEEYTIDKYYEIVPTGDIWEFAKWEGSIEEILDDYF